MDVLIIGFSKIKYMPYLNFYLDNIDTYKNQVHVVYWNRDLEDDAYLDNSIIVHEFRHYMKDESNRLKKIPVFFSFRRFVRTIMKANNFDRIIVLHTMPGILMQKELLNGYKGQYIYDYRDYTYESYSFFRKRVHSLVECSYLTFISSDAYRKFLPQKPNKLMRSHNLDMGSLSFKGNGMRRREEPIILSFWGLIRHYDINVKIIEAVGRDQRFELHYYGREEETAKKLIKLKEKKNISNVHFHGTYMPVERYEFAKGTMMLNNLYAADDINASLAIGNKYYDGIVFGLPQLCIIGSYMGELVMNKGIGLACDPNDPNFLDAVYEYYQSVLTTDIRPACHAQLREILKDVSMAEDAITGFIADN